MCAMMFLIVVGVVTANEGLVYVLRRVIIRADLHARRIGMTRPLAEAIVVTAEIFEEPYPELAQRAGQIGVAVAAESLRFQKTLEQGLEQFEKVASRGTQTVSGADAFRLHDTFGFPLELTRELAR